MKPAIDTDAARLRLMFECCLPFLTKQEQVSLTLHTLGGLTTAEIARALLIREADVVQQITAAEFKTKPISVPSEEATTISPDRLDAVRSVIYLIFNEGYCATAGSCLIRVDLCAEAICLCRILCNQVTDDAENLGLLALMLLQDSRRDARVDSFGDLVTLEHQDRSLWHWDQIEEGLSLIARSVTLPGAGLYFLQASIAAVHAQAKTYDATDWRLISDMYSQLLRLSPSPVIELNRAVSVAMSGGLEEGLRLIDEISIAGDLNEYHLLHAARADIFRRLGRTADASGAYRRAISLTENLVEQRYLSQRLRELGITVGVESGVPQSGS